MRRGGRGRSERGAAAVEAGLLLAGVAAALVAAGAVLSEQLEVLLQAALQAVSGG